MDFTSGIRQTFSEKHVFSVMHIFMPAIIYIYLDAFSFQKKVLWYFTIVYVFESVEYFVYGTRISAENLHETAADTLVNDIVMAVLGLWAAIVYTSLPEFRTRFIPKGKGRFLCCYNKGDCKPCYGVVGIFIHLISLCVACLLITYGNIMTSSTSRYIFYTVSYTVLSIIFINIEWTLFSAFCFFFISIGATDVYQRDFMYVPIVNVIVMPAMTILAYLWYKNNCCKSILTCFKNSCETWDQRTARFSAAKLSPPKVNGWRYARC